MQSTGRSLDDVRVNLEFTKRPTLIKGSLSARGRPCAHILTMRDGDWRMLTLIRARSVSLARERGLVGWSRRSVGRSAHTYANHIRRRWLPGGDEHRPIPPRHRLLLYPGLSVHGVERRESSIQPPFLPVLANSRAPTIAWIKLNGPPRIVSDNSE